MGLVVLGSAGLRSAGLGPFEISGNWYGWARLGSSAVVELAEQG